MKSWIFILLRWLSLPILGLQIYAALWALGQAIIWKACFTSPLLWAFAGGFAFRSGFGKIWQSLGKTDPLDFIDTLEHELTHALFGYLTFSPPQSLSATLKDGGEVLLARANPLIALGPYFLPLWVCFIWGIGFLIQEPLQWKWSLLLGGLLGSFIYRMSKELRFYQTDLQAYGFLFSALVIVNMWLIFLALFLHSRHLFSADWLKQSLPHTQSLLKNGLVYLKTHLL